MEIQNSEKVMVKEIPVQLVKSNQGFLVAGTIIAILLQSKIIVYFLFLTAISSLLFGPQANLAFRVAKPIFAHRLFYAKTEAVELQRFNQLIACFCLGMSSILLTMGFTLSGYVFSGFITMAASFALGGYCLGCTIYFPYKMWVRNAREKYSFLNWLFDFIAGTGPFRPPFQLKPQPLMLMGLAHESIRSAVKEIENMARSKKEVDLIELKGKVDELNRFINLHALQEDTRMYPPIDAKCNGITAQFESEHDEVAQLEKDMNAALQDIANGKSSNNDVTNLVLKWCDYTNQHLRNEEAVLMPKLPKVLTYDESAAVLRSILEIEQEEFINFHLAYAFKGLDPGQRYNYVNILKSCCEASQFSEYESVLKPLVPQDAWQDFGAGHRMN